jgi:hypothetical protein
MQSEREARTEKRELEFIAIWREESTMESRDEYGNHHLKRQQSASQSRKHPEKDRQSSEQFHRDHDRRGHKWQWKPELPHNVCGSADAEDEELLPPMHQEYKSYDNPQWQHPPLGESSASVFHLTCPRCDEPDRSSKVRHLR